MTACALSYGQREEEYLETVKGYDRDELSEFAKAMGALVSQVEKRLFSDPLGTYYQEIGSKLDKDLRGEFYTPDSISKLMTSISMDVDKVVQEGLPITVGDPAVGSGRMILQMAEQFPRDSVSLIRATLQDISPTAVHCAFINTTLNSIPAQVIHGNTLTGERLSVWKNIHWLRVGEDERLETNQRIKQMVQIMKDLSESSSQPIPKTTESFDYKVGEGGQMEMF